MKNAYIIAIVATLLLVGLGLNQSTALISPISEKRETALGGEPFYAAISAFLAPETDLIQDLLAKNSRAESSARNTDKNTWQESYGNLPLSFEVNQGQTARAVKFLSRGNGYNLFLTSTEAVLSLRNQKSKVQSPKSARRTRNSGLRTPNSSAVLRMKFVGANLSPQVVGVDELAGKNNYFIGNDPAKWRTDVSNYAKVKYESVYPGVDLVYYGNQRQLEYDFIVAPGADASRIKLSLKGARKVLVDRRGDLVLRTGGGDVRWQKPIVYQEIDGRRTEVEGSYALLGDSKVAFNIGPYDHSLPLVIDPVLVYSSFLGGAGDETAYLNNIAVDSGGNAYVVGGTSSINFPTTGAYQSAKGGGTSDIFITKINAAGTGLVFSTYLGGSLEDLRGGIAVDNTGNVYVSGETTSVNFPITAGAYQPTKGANVSGFNDAFVTKLNQQGNALVYSTYLGGNGGESANGIAVDTAGNAYVAGQAFGGTFPTVNALQPTRTDDYMGFVSKLNPTGTSLIYSTFLGGNNDTYGAQAIAVDNSGNAYVTGTTSATNFPSGGAFQTHGGGFDAFVTKLNTNASGAASLVYSSYLGGSGADTGFGINLDASGNAYVTGQTISTNFPTTSPLQASNGGGADVFVTKVNPAGSAKVYSTYIGGSGSDSGQGIDVDGSGNAYVTGNTASANFPAVGASQPALGGGQDAFVVKLNTAGSALVYSTYLGGSASDAGQGIAVDSSGNAYILGSTASTNFPLAGAFQPSYAGGASDAFVAKIGDIAAPPNNDFANAQVLTGPVGVATGVNVGANKQTGEPNHGGNAGGASVWYRWEAPASGPAYFNTLGSDFDTLLGIYTGSSVNALTLVGGNDNFLDGDIGYVQSQVRFNPVQGTVYYIAVDGKNGATGNITLRWGIAGAAGCVAPPANMVSWWPGDGNANDIRGTNNGTLLGGATATATGRVAQAFSFNGTSGHVALGNPASLKISGAISIDAWINPSGMPANNTLAAIMTKWAQQVGGGSTADSYGLWVVNRGGTPRLFSALNFTSGAEPNIEGGTIPLNTWSHVAMTWDPAAGRYSIYINGEQVATQMHPGSTLLATDRNVAIGKEESILTRFFPGLIDEVGIFTRSLEQTEIQAIFNAGPAGKCKPGFVPPNNDFENAEIVGGLTGGANGVNTGANKQTGEPNHGSNVGGKSVWYRWTAPITGPAFFNTLGSDFDTLLGIYTGSSVGALTLIGQNDNFFQNDIGFIQSEVRFNAVAGTVYYIAVDGKNGVTGNITLNWGVSNATPSPTPTLTPVPTPMPSPTPTPGANAGRIVFTSSRDGNFEIYSMNPDGTGQMRLTNNIRIDSGPDLSPDGSRIVFTGNSGGDWGIYAMNANGTGETRLTTAPGIHQSPAFSPDGSRIVFSSGRDGISEIYIMNADGTGQTRLTNNSDVDLNPDFSPSGDRIVYTSRVVGGEDEIYTMNTDGTGQTRLTNNSAADFEPTFGPDGRIAFSSNREGNFAIFLMNANGSNVTRLTMSFAEDREPTFSPDGTRIAFSRVINGIFDVYTINANGSGQVRLTQLGGSGPSWGASSTTTGPTPTPTSCATTADYQFQDARASSVGTPPALTDIGAGSNTFVTDTVNGVSRRVLQFPQGNGVQLQPTSGTIANDTYSIVTLFKLANVDGFRRVLEFKNGTADRGIYVAGGVLNFYSSFGTGSTPISANTYVQVVLTRTAAGTVTAFVNGVQQFSFLDSGDDAVIDSNNVLRFFKDNTTGGGTGEESAGSVARIRLYNCALTPAEVAALDSNPTPTPPPTPIPTLTPVPSPTQPSGATRIVFASNRDGNFEIYSMNPDGTDPRRLTDHPDEDRHPRISPDGTRIAFDRTTNGNRDIYIMNSDGSNPTRLTTAARSDSRPSFSPDGTKIVFDSERNTLPFPAPIIAAIFVMNLDGTNQTALTASPRDDVAPTFSPNGSRIAFESLRDSPSGDLQNNLYVMNPDGTNQTRLTATGNDFGPPRYSPDGNRIIFSVRNFGTQIFSINADGTNRTRLTTPAVDTYDAGPTFSPNGNLIAFSRLLGGGSDIFVMNADGSGQTRIDFPGSYEVDPDWGVLNTIAGPTPTPGGPPGLTADYQFQNTRNSSAGGPALTDIITSPNAANSFATEAVDGCAPRTVLNFPKGNGLSLAPTTGLITDNKTYSIVLLFKFTEQDHSRAIVDFKNGMDGRGSYANAQNNLEFQNASNNGPGISIGTGSPITANKYVQVVLTRQGSEANQGRAGIDTGYVDGVQQYRIDHLNADGMIDPKFNTLRFFLNQLSAAQNYSAGAVARIRVFNRVLSAAEVAALDRLPSGACAGPSPTPTLGPTPGPTPTPTPIPTPTLPPGTPTPTPTATPSAGQIVFSSNRDGNYEIYMMNPDGTGLTRLTNNPANDLDPVLSGDGTRVVFQSDRDGDQKLYVMNRDGTGQTRLTTGPGNEYSPDVSRVDNRVVFSTGRDGNFEIYTINIDGSGLTRLTTNTEHDFEPAWSPDGTKIAFSGNRIGDIDQEIYVMNADGTIEVRLTNSFGFDTSPTFTPDGRIVFVSARNGEPGLYVMNINGTGAARIPNTGSGDHGPSVSPDGGRIAFFGDRVALGNQEIFVMNADGSGQINISNNGAIDVDPNWGPPPGTPIPTPTPSGVPISGRVFTPTGLGLRNAVVTLTDAQNNQRRATTSSFGVYSFDNVPLGSGYTLTVSSKRFRFAPRSLDINATLMNVDFVGLE